MKEVLGEILCRIEKDTRKPVLNVVAIARNGQEDCGVAIAKAIGSQVAEGKPEAYVRPERPMARLGVKRREMRCFVNDWSAAWVGYGRVRLRSSRHDQSCCPVVGPAGVGVTCRWQFPLDREFKCLCSNLIGS